MKAVYFGNDLFYSCLLKLIEKGIDVCAAYVNNVDGHVQTIERLCRRFSIEVKHTKPTQAELEKYAQMGVELFIAADYQYRIPIIDIHYSINIHPSLLPKGRGPTPLTYLINQKAHAGVTLHKLADKFDAGDILIQKPISLTEYDSLDTLMVKTHLLAESLLALVLDNLEETFNSSLPQDEASATYWSLPNASQQFISWRDNVETIRSKVKSFGCFGVIVEISKQRSRCTSLQAVEHHHNFKPGAVVYSDWQIIAIAVVDGVCCIKRSHLEKIN